MFQGLSEGVYDLLLYPVELDHEIDDFICEPLAKIKMVVLASKDHPAAKMIKPTLKDLYDYDWLSPSKTGIPKRLIKSAFLKEGLRYPNHVQVYTTLEMVPVFLRNSESLAFFPTHPAINGHMNDEFTVIDVDMSEMSWTLYTLYRKSAPLTKGLLAMLLALRKTISIAELKSD